MGWSPLWNKHVHHGEMGAKKCCWYGDWTHKSKCDDGHDDDKDTDKCWSPLWNKHVHHGQMGAEKCCWYGDWTHKSKCGGHDDDKDKDKCWSPLWNKHVHHGEMGAKKCCWYGDWTHKSKCDGHDDDKDKKYVVKSDQSFPPSAKTTFKSHKSFFDACTKCCAYIQGHNQNADGWDCTYQEENQTKFCYKLDVQYADYCF